jgi:hypothetical protein
MLLLTFYAYRRSAAVRHATVLFGAAFALLMITEFALLATPMVSAQPAPADAMVVLEARYSGEPQLLPIQRTPLDLSIFAEP